MNSGGPAALGRGVVVSTGQEVPPPWRDALTVHVDAAAVADPAEVVETLHRAWTRRMPVVVVLDVDPAGFRQPRSFTDAPWVLGPSFEPWWDRLQFLVWANNYDARCGTSSVVWWWGRKAARLGGASVASQDQAGDVCLADGSGAWIDGGPRTPFPLTALDGLAVIHAESVDLGSIAPVPPPVTPQAVLAPDQLAAVGHGGGPARIVAPAGSGKTRVLTERLRHLLRDRGYERDLVLAVAYNKKAQQEMEQRLADLVPQVRTLNALGYRLLADARGTAPRVLEEREVRRLIERFVPLRRQRRANTDPIGPYLEGLSQIRLGLADPEAVEQWRDDVPGLAAAFDPYRAALIESGSVDFDEQIYGCLELLLSDGSFRQRAQRQCRHLLVDEFQDITPAHLLLLRLLSAPQLDVFGVGDDDQVIYGHAGADPGFLIGFDRLFPGAADHPLEVNYRCPQVVVTKTGHLLSHNQRRVAKSVRPGPSASTDPDAFGVVLHPGAGGADALVEVVRGWLDGGAAPSEIAVLTRVNSLLLAPHVALRAARIPASSPLGPEVLERTGTRAALAYLRIAAAPDGSVSAEDVTEILRRPSRGLPQWFSDRIRRRHSWSLRQLAAIAGQVAEKEATKVEWLVADLTTLRAAGAKADATTRSVLACIKDTIGLGSAMGLLDSSRGGEGSSHLDDLDALEQVAGLHPDFRTFDPWLREQLVDGFGPAPASSVEDADSVGGITLSTIHRVKGMEWDRVAVFGVNAGIVPHRLADDVEEERRVLHVGVTRCRQQVRLLADESRPSPLLAQLEAPAGGTGDSAGVRRAVAGGPDRGAVGVVTAAQGGGGRVAASSVYRKAASVPVGPGAVADPMAEQALRAWRSERARRDAVPAFVVLHDATLVAIASSKPATLAALRRIEGIGPAKLENYGEDILAVLATIASDTVASPG